MQKIFLIGRLGKDARIVETQHGGRFISFPIAVNSRSNGAEKTTWYDVRSFNYSDKMLPYFTKGSSLVVTGELDATIEERDDKRYLRLSVLADSIDFNHGNSGQQNNDTSGETQTNVSQVTPISTDEEEVVVTATKATKAPVQKFSAQAPSQDEDLPF